MRIDPKRHLTQLFKFLNDRSKENPDSRSLGPIFKVPGSDSTGPEAKAGAASGFAIPKEFSPKDYLSFLVTIDSELEHGLMVMYLYGAYSLGGTQVDAAYQPMVRQWQETILGIAKEEMGHFISVNNVLRCIGAPLNFSRQDFPWDSMFYPFPFKLEKLSIESLAKYVYAESPVGWIDGGSQEANEIRDILGFPPLGSNLKSNFMSSLFNPEFGEPISLLFEAILDLLNNEELIPNDTFQAATYPFQAKFDEWGRGYSGGQRGNSQGGNPAGAPDVLVEPLLSRTDTINAVTQIGEQGEAQGADAPGTLPSHFERFLNIYIQYRDTLAADSSFEPSRNLADNPYIPNDGSPSEAFDTSGKVASKSEGLVSNEPRDPITNPEAQLWANLFNVRYRMLLAFLAHSFQLDGGFNNNGNFRPRGLIVNSTFGEMYNIRSITHALIQLKISTLPTETKYAGPPFTQPYTLDLPIGEYNIWRLHQEMIQASLDIVQTLINGDIPSGVAPATGRNLNFLNSLKEADDLLLKSIIPLTQSTQPI